MMKQRETIGGLFWLAAGLGLSVWTATSYEIGSLTQSGPLLISKHPDLFWGTIASMYIGNVMLVILNLPLIGLWVKLLKVPYNILFPLILLFCLIGVYGLNNNMYEILIMVIFGVFGYVIRKFEKDERLRTYQTGIHVHRPVGVFTNRLVKEGFL